MKESILPTSAYCLALLLLPSCSRKESPTPASDLVTNTNATNSGDKSITQYVRTNTITDKVLIKELIFKDLGIDEKPGPADYDFGYYIVAVDSDEVQHFSNLYKGHVPRVVVSAPGTASINALVDDEMQDRKTKLPCELLSLDIKILKKNHAEVSVGIISGTLGGAFYDYILTNDDKGWRIVEKKLTGAI